jgi:amino acid transporter
MYCAGGSKSLYGISASKCAPSVFLKVNKRGIPVSTIAVNYVIGIAIFIAFKGWNELSAFLTCMLALTYIMAPVCMVILRKQLPDFKRPFKLPFGYLWSYIAFFLCNLIIYFSGWQVIRKISVFFIFCFIIILLYSFINRKGKSNEFGWKTSIWLWPYLCGMTVVSYIGDFGGGYKIVSNSADIEIIALLTLLIMMLALMFKLPSKEINSNIKNGLSTE